MEGLDESRRSDKRVLPDYDVVVVHYKNDKIYKLLQQIYMDDVPPRQTVIADNSQDFDMTHLEHGRRVPTSVVRLANPGYAAAINNAVASLSSRSPFLLVLTHEVKIFPGAVELLLEEMIKSEATGIVGPLLVDNDAGRTVYSAGGYYKRGGRPRHLTLSQVKAGVEPQYVDGAVMLIRGAAFDRVDGFDERYFLYYEDNDICMRVRKAGFDIGVATAARFGQQTGNFTTYYQMRNQMLFSRTYSNVPGAIFACVLKAGGAGRASIRARDSSPFVGAMRGAWHGLTSTHGPDTGLFLRKARTSTDA